MSHPRDSRRLDGGLPDRRLPDAGLALDDERRQPAGATVKERRNGSELVPPHDDLVRHADPPALRSYLLMLTRLGLFLLPMRTLHQTVCQAVNGLSLMRLPPESQDPGL